LVVDYQRLHLSSGGTPHRHYRHEQQHCRKRLAPASSQTKLRPHRSHQYRFVPECRRFLGSASAVGAPVTSRRPKPPTRSHQPR
jgi:hypothetical protein